MATELNPRASISALQHVTCPPWVTIGLSRFREAACPHPCGCGCHDVETISLQKQLRQRSACLPVPAPGLTAAKGPCPVPSAPDRCSMGAPASAHLCLTDTSVLPPGPHRQRQNTLFITPLLNSGHLQTFISLRNAVMLEFADELSGI